VSASDSGHSGGVSAMARTSPSVHQAVYDVLYTALRRVLGEGMQAGPGAAEGIDSLPCRVSGAHCVRAFQCLGQVPIQPADRGADRSQPPGICRGERLAQTGLVLGRPGGRVTALDSPAASRGPPLWSTPSRWRWPSTAVGGSS
jgi:hypothetical protein